MRVTKSTWVDVGSGGLDDIYNALGVLNVPANARLVEMDEGYVLTAFSGETYFNARLRFEWEVEE